MTADAAEVDFERLLAQHQPDRDDFCRECGEEYPCGPAWAAGRVLRFRQQRKQREQRDEAQDDR